MLTLFPQVNLPLVLFVSASKNIFTCGNKVKDYITLYIVSLVFKYLYIFIKL